jgi:flagellar protein FlgJ
MDALDHTVPAPQALTDVLNAKPVVAADAAYRAQAKAAAEKFEGFFISEMMKQMRRSTRELGGDDAIFKDRLNDDMLEMADTMMADALSGQHAFGVADAILRQLLPATDAAPALNELPAPVALDK